MFFLFFFYFIGYLKLLFFGCIFYLMCHFNIMTGRPAIIKIDFWTLWSYYPYCPCFSFPSTPLSLLMFFLFPHSRWLRSTKAKNSVPGSRCVRDPCHCFWLGKPSSVQSLSDQNQGVPLWWQWGLQCHWSCSSCWTGHWGHHCNTYLHHHPAQWVQE